MSTPFAVVTGASSGIGLELAKQFVDNGYDLLICAEDRGVGKVRDQLAVAGAQVSSVQADLRSAEGVEALYEAIKTSGRDVDALALNAGIGQGGAFVDQDLDDILAIVQLNVASTVHLARLVLADMATRNDGRVLITSSIASLMPGSYQAVYNASKSFLQSFAQALQTELNDTNVVVTALLPGPTETNFFERAGMAASTRIGRSTKDDPSQVAAQGFKALMAGRRRVVGGSPATKVQYLAGVLLPDRAKAALHSVMAKPTRRAS